MDRLDRRLILLIRLFVLPGFAAATYLTYTAAFHKAIACRGGCEVVANSQWHAVFGVNVTVIGMVAYLTIFGATFVKRDEAKILAAFAATCGAVFSIFLQYQSLVVLEHFCPYCFTSAVCMQFLAILTITRLVRLPKIDLSEFDSADEFEDDDAADVPTTAGPATA